MRREVWFYLSLLLAGGIFGFVTHAENSASAQPVAAAAPLTADDCSGGAESELELDLDLAQVNAVGDREHATLVAGVQHRFAGNAAVKYSLELVDDRGRDQQAPTISAIQKGTRPLDELAASLEVAGLADGFYEARLTAAVRIEAGRDSATSTESFYFRIQRGALVPLDLNEWIAKSAAGQPQVHQ